MVCNDDRDRNTALGNITRLIAILAAPHGYVATARLLDGVSGNRLVLEARLKSTAGDGYEQEISLESLEALGPTAVAHAFDRAARAAFALSDSDQQPASTPDPPGKAARSPRV